MHTYPDHHSLSYTPNTLPIIPPNPLPTPNINPSNNRCISAPWWPRASARAAPRSGGWTPPSPASRTSGTIGKRWVRSWMYGACVYVRLCVIITDTHPTTLFIRSFPPPHPLFIQPQSHNTIHTHTYTLIINSATLSPAAPPPAWPPPSGPPSAGCFSPWRRAPAFGRASSPTGVRGLVL